MGEKGENNKKEIRKSQYRRGENPNSRKNLRPATDGEVRNPNGRGEGHKNLSTLLKEMLREIAPNEIISSKFVKEFCKGRTSITNADALTARLISEGLIKGESWAIKEIFDRTEGKAQQSVDVTSNGETIATFCIDTKPK